VVWKIDGSAWPHRQFGELLAVADEISVASDQERAGTNFAPRLCMVGRAKVVHPQEQSLVRKIAVAFLPSAAPDPRTP
jgi:hypothetical protein